MLQLRAVQERESQLDRALKASEATLRQVSRDKRVAQAEAQVASDPAGCGVL